MGLELVQFKVAGGLVVLIASFGLVVMNGQYAAKVNGDWTLKKRNYFSSSASTLFSCSLAVTIIGVFVVIALLGGIVLTVLGLDVLPPIVVVGLFGGGAGLFLGVLIATAIAVSTSKWLNTYADVADIEASIYNESDKIRTYVDGYLLYRKNPPPVVTPAGTLSPTLVPPSGPAKTLTPEAECLDKFTSGWSPETSDFGVWLRWKKPQLMSEGGFTDVFTISELMSFSYYYDNLPLKERVTWDKGNGDTPWLLPKLFYSDKSAAVCYGVTVTSESIDKAADNKDICDVEVKVRECAPGWSASAASTFLCQSYRNCITEEEETRKEEREKTDVYGKFGAGPVLKAGSDPAEYEYVLPVGWSKLPELTSWWKSYATDEEINPNLVGYSWLKEDGGLALGYYQFNLIFLVVGVVGWVFLVVGIVFGFLGGGKDGDS